MAAWRRELFNAIVLGENLMNQAAAAKWRHLRRAVLVSKTCVAAAWRDSGAAASGGRLLMM